MAKEFQLHVRSADRDFYEGGCVSLVLPTLDGEHGVLAGHSNMAVAVVPGIMRYRLPDGTQKTAVVGNGVARVERDDVMVLVGSVEHPEEIDAARAAAAADRARAELLKKHSWQEYLQTQANLKRAINRLKAVGKG